MHEASLSYPRFKHSGGIKIGTLADELPLARFHMSQPTSQPTCNMIAHAVMGFPPIPRLTTLLHLGIGASRAEHPRGTGGVSSIPYHISFAGFCYLLACFILQAGSSFLFSIYT